MKRVLFIIFAIILGSGFAFARYSFNVPGTDYNKAVTEKYTDEPSLEVLNTVNAVLNYIRDSRPDKFINKGPYIAMLKKKETGEQTGGSTGVNTKVENLQPCVLDITRDLPTTANPNPPMKVKFWLYEPDSPDGSPMRVVGYIVVEHGVDKNYPVGKLRMDARGFKLNADGSTDQNQLVLKVALETDKSNENGKADVKYHESDLINGQWVSLVLNLTYDPKDGGSAFTQVFDDTNNKMVAYKLALGDNDYKMQELDVSNNLAPVGNPVCKSRIKFIKVVYKYGLFDLNGNKIQINAGFPIKAVKNGKTYHGYVGYWGLWSEGNAIINGDTVTKEDDPTKTYTIFQTKGKLIKYTKSTITMNELIGSRLFFNATIQNQNQYQNYAIHWNGSAFVVDGVENCSNNNCQIVSTSVGFNDLEVNQYSMAWSPALQSNIPIYNVSNNTPISYYQQEVVVPSSDLNLYNYGNEIINPDMDTSNPSNYPEAIVNDPNNVERSYTYDATNGVLVDNVLRENVVVPANADFTANGVVHTWWRWGAQMGPLLTEQNPTYKNEPWRVMRDAPVYYMWETGNNAWNKATVLKEANGNIITFDKPLAIPYKQQKVNDLNNEIFTQLNKAGYLHDGKFYNLYYDGNSLGINWQQDSNYGWIPEINIKSGTILHNQYAVKDLIIGLIPVKENSCNIDLSVADNKVVTNADTFLPFNDNIIGTIVGYNPPDANVSVVDGKCVKADCSL